MAAMSEALVIGNGAYSPNVRLECPPNDAAAVAKSLRELNFHVSLGIDLTYDAAQALINEFVSLVNAPSTTVSLLYYSGHGMQIYDQNYIVSIDFDHFEDQKITKLVHVQSIVDKMTNATAVRIVLLDACRNNADARAFVGGKGIVFEKAIIINYQPLLASGLAEMRASSNTFIAFAAAPGDVAYEGLASEPLSPFTASLVKYLDLVDLPISNLTSRVRQDVLKHTQEKQRTWDQSSLMEPFYFNPGSTLLFTGNLMALVGLMLSMIPYSLVLSWATATWPWVATAAALPLISLAILLFGTQSVYSRLRGKFQADSDQHVTVRDHLKTSIQKGILGGYLGAQFAALLISALYYEDWSDASEPFGALLVEITIATALTACVLGTLSLFFARVSIRMDGLKLSEAPSWHRVVIGSTFGGVLAGILAAPLLMVHFGVMNDRPLMTPRYLLPGSILGASIIIFSIVNFDFERLNAHRVWTSAMSAFVASCAGVLVAGLVFGPLYAVGIVDAVINWLKQNAADSFVMATGGAIYGIPVGLVLGVVIGLALVLTQVWSRKPVFG
jgi:hypothetical protein